MKKSKRVQVLVDLALTKENDAAQKLAKEYAKVEIEKEKLVQLEHYSEQYRSERNLIGLNRYLSLNYQHFVDRLSQAISQQKLAIQRAEQQANFVKQQWLKARSKSKSMTWLQDKYVVTEAAQEAKREQSQSDEFAMRRFLEKMR